MNNNENAQLIKLATAGSVDDGKSTLIGRLLYDSNAIYTDHLEALKKASAKKGFDGLDLSLLTDGLAAEREQQITIDVAYTHFSTEKRKYIIADVPGHEQYTRNMITGISGADLVIILVDARKGLLVQSKRHLFLASLARVPHVLVVINKIDLVDYEEKIFNQIKNDFLNFIPKLDLNDLQFIPVSALRGDMVVNRGEKLPWYQGPTLLGCLENLQIINGRNLIDFRFPVQYVIRPNQDMRGYAGKIMGGVIKKGEEITVLPSGKKSSVRSILLHDKELECGFNPQSVVLTLEDELDISRGDVIVREGNLPEVNNAIEATVCWMSKEPLVIGKTYIIKHGTRVCKCAVDKIRYKINVDDLHREPSNNLSLNEIGRVFVGINEPIIFDPYRQNKNTGSFIIIDIDSNNTIATGMIVRGIKKETAARKKGALLWFTGLSGSGKTTVADKVFELLQKRNIPSERLDGDIIRQIFCNDLGFSKEDRDKNINRAFSLAQLLNNHGVLVLATFISPYRQKRNEIRQKADKFIEIHTNTPLTVCEERDVKGLYKKARAGLIPNFTGIDDVYEPPENPEILLDTNNATPSECAEAVIDYLEKNNLL